MMTILAQEDLAVSLQAGCCLLEVALRVQKIDPLVRYESPAMSGDYTNETRSLCFWLSEHIQYVQHKNAEFPDIVKSGVKTANESSVCRRISVHTSSRWHLARHRAYGRSSELFVRLAFSNNYLLFYYI
jgi:hypothetical protein